MRDCYKKYWKFLLVEKMMSSYPQFILRESAARKEADLQKPSTKPVNFVWSPSGKLNFTIEFCAPGKQDHFEAWFYWSEKGKVGANGTADFDQPFAENSYELESAAVMLQTLSNAIGDNPRVFFWAIWAPKTSVFENRPAWYAEFAAEEARMISDEESFQRVGLAVDKAIFDIQRLALPWFERKLERYKVGH